MEIFSTLFILRNEKLFIKRTLLNHLLGNFFYLKISRGKNVWKRLGKQAPSCSADGL